MKIKQNFSNAMSKIKVHFMYVSNRSVKRHSCECHYLFLQDSWFLHFFSSLFVATEDLVNNIKKAFLSPYFWDCDIFGVKKKQTHARVYDNKETVYKYRRARKYNLPVKL